MSRSQSSVSYGPAEVTRPDKIKWRKSSTKKQAEANAKARAKTARKRTNPRGK